MRREGLPVLVTCLLHLTTRIVPERATSQGKQRLAAGVIGPEESQLDHHHVSGKIF